MKLVAVLGDMSSHGNGSINSAGVIASVLVNGMPIAINGGFGLGSDGDVLCDPTGITTKVHCHPLEGGTPGPCTGALTVFAGDLPVHRIGDDRLCGATTMHSAGLRTVTVPDL